MGSKFESVRVPVLASISVGQAMIGGHRTEPQQYEWVTKLKFNNKNVEILADYIEMRRERFGLDIGTLDALKTRPWSLEGMMADEQKYTGKIY